MPALRVKETVVGGVELEKGLGREPAEQQQKRNVLTRWKATWDYLSFPRVPCACLSAEAEPPPNQNESLLYLLYLLQENLRANVLIDSECSPQENSLSFIVPISVPTPYGTN